MKCKECGRLLKDFYYLIVEREFCKGCAIEFISDVREYKVNLKHGAPKQ